MQTTFRKFVVPMVVLLVPQGVLAQDGPTFDCAKAESSAEKLICTDAGLASLDQRLAGRFAAAMKVAENLDSGAKEAADTLRATQRGWIKGRDDCWKEPDLGTCVRTSYLRREAELVAQFLLEPASRTIELFCGPPTRDLVAMEFATELPGIRVEEADHVFVGAQFSEDKLGYYYLSGAGMLNLAETDRYVEDAYGERSDCRPAG